MPININTLLSNTCKHSVQPLNNTDIIYYLSLLDKWYYEQNKLVKQFIFQNFYKTLSFVNAIAYLIHAENHHPELILTYNSCMIKFNTHSINNGHGGLSLNDFICAAKIDILFAKNTIS